MAVLVFVRMRVLQFIVVSNFLLRGLTPGPAQKTAEQALWVAVRVLFRLKGVVVRDRGLLLFDDFRCHRILL